VRKPARGAAGGRGWPGSSERRAAASALAALAAFAASCFLLTSSLRFSITVTEMFIVPN